MIIEIDNEWRLSSDSLQWIVQRRNGWKTDRRSGKRVERWDAQEYWREWPDALDALFKMRIRLSGVKGPPDVCLEEMRMIHADFLRLKNRIAEMSRELPRETVSEEG